jgi:hypothetical protein
VLHRLVAGFADAAEAYDRGRPRYPPAVVEAILAAVPGRRVLDVGAGTGQLARVVRADGGVVVSSLQPHGEQAWQVDVRAVLEPLRQAARHPHVTGNRRPIALEGAGFDALEHRDIPFVYTTDREGMLAYYASISFVGGLPAARRAQVLAELDAILARHHVGEVAMPCRAELWITRRRRAPAPPPGPAAAAS